jgi:hypothetical protein
MILHCAKVNQISLRGFGALLFQTLLDVCGMHHYSEREWDYWGE